MRAKLVMVIEEKLDKDIKTLIPVDNKAFIKRH
jgi:hypothetical protein